MYEQLQERKESSGNKTESRFIQGRSQYFLELEALGLVSGKAEMKNEDICFHSLGYK